VLAVDDLDCKLYVGEAAAVLRTLPNDSVHAVVTSPPYWRLKDYEQPEQLGQERTPDEYVHRLVSIMSQVWPVLRGDGSVWVNIGDTYERGDLVGIPWRFALKMKDAGWRLRSENVWRKLGAMPEQVKDRTSREHEHLFHFVKGPGYYYDRVAIMEASVEDMRSKRNKRSVWSMPTANFPGAHDAVFPLELPLTCIAATTSEKGVCPTCGEPAVRKVSEVSVNRHELPRDHPAYRPARYDEGKAGSDRGPGAGQRFTEVATTGWADPICQHGGRVPAVVLDPFAGAATTLVAARRSGRNSIGIELSPDYAAEVAVPRLATWWKDVNPSRRAPQEDSLFNFAEGGES
jgi:DNA modification methylase